MRIAVLGIGSIGRRHLRNLRALHPEAKLLAADPSADARRWAKTETGAEAFAEVAQALSREPSAAIIATPTGRHVDDLTACVQRGMHAYVEKPLASTPSAALRTALTDADRCELVIAVATNMRYEPGAMKLKEVLDSGRVGKPVSIHAHAGFYLPYQTPNRNGRDYRTSYAASAEHGGALLDYAHELDLIRWWAGDIRALSAAVRHASDIEIGGDDVADLLIELSGGAIATLHVDYLERCKRRFVRMVGTRGSVTWDVVRQKVEVVDERGSTTVELDEPDYDRNASYRAAIAGFLDAATDRSRPDHRLPTGWDGLAVTTVIDAAKRSAHRRRWIEIPLGDPRHMTNRFETGANGSLRPERQRRASGNAGLNQPPVARAEVDLDQPPIERGPAPEGRLAKSHALLARARRVIPSATQTMSKGPPCFVQNATPVYLQRGRGARVWDVDGHEYVDWGMALGPIVLGYGDPDVAAAVSERLLEGTTFTLPHPLEVEVAELLVETIPCAEMVRFLKTGSEAASAAVRIARAYTGRDLLAVCGYHGWHDWYACTRDLNRGIPGNVADHVIAFAYNNFDALEQIFRDRSDRVAAVIMEPTCLIPPGDGFLEQVRECAHAHGALLVFDEVVTGFRWALGGAQEYFDVTPDLAVFGKAMANGMPLAAVVGRADVMRVLENGVFVSSTFGGETASLAAAKTTIAKLRETEAIDTMWRRGATLRNEIGRLLAEHGLQDRFQINGPSCRFAVTAVGDQRCTALELRSILQQELVRCGVLSNGLHVMCTAHREAEIAATLSAYADALPVLRRAIEAGDIRSALAGPVIEPVFKR